MSNTLSTRVSGKVSSRGWAIALGIGAIVLATILLVVYLDRYRARVGGANVPTPVLVAKQTIPAGTPGGVVTRNNMYEATELAKKDVLEGALADPTYLEGRAASRAILPGQQITVADFAASLTTTVDSQITGTQRAISVGIDQIHGSLPQLAAGDFVDIYVSVAGTVKLFKPNVQVLTVPTAVGGNLILKIDTKEAARFAYAADNAQLWFVLRPAAGAKPTQRSSASASTIVR
jgi:Flp pilus assembly protein CpaB